MVHFVYRITNTITGSFYIGIHSTDDIDDGYMGSGYNIRKAIKNHGIENFVREIVSFHDSRQEALKEEARIVDKGLIMNPKCYNIALGGIGSRTPKLFDKDWFFEFKVDYDNMKAWILSTDEHLSKCVKTDIVELQIFLNNQTADIWPNIVTDLTRLYNFKSTHHKAQKILKTIAAKNVMDCLYIEQTKRLVTA